MKRISLLTAFIGAGCLGTSLLSSLLPWSTEESEAVISSRPESPPLRLPANAATASRLSQSTCRDLHHIVCHAKGTTRDPSGSVQPEHEGEEEARHLRLGIEEDHPEWSPEEVAEELASRIYTPKVRNRVQEAFRWSRRTIERDIDRQADSIFTREEKRLLKKKLRAVVLELPPSAQLYADEPEMLTKNDVNFERLADGTTRLRVGGGYLMAAQSWFNLIFTLGHELAHAIDPCELKHELLGESSALPAHSVLPAYEGLTSCFKRTGLLPLPEQIKEYKECTRNDRLSETFADWLAARVAGEALGTFATEFRGAALRSAVINSVRDLCEPDDNLMENDTEFHPPAEVRIEKIFGRNPRILKVLGCSRYVSPPRSVEYCQFTGRSPEYPLPHGYKR